MSLWTIHPKYLDQKGLVALWRETLLAKAVLESKTKGYTNHPQLVRFRKFSNSILAINKYLSEIYAESCKRGFHFDKSKFMHVDFAERVDVTSGQIKYEANHLKSKLKVRDVGWLNQLDLAHLEVFSVFKVVAGDVEEWEKVR